MAVTVITYVIATTGLQTSLIFVEKDKYAIQSQNTLGISFFEQK